jgi:hypothetical protein
MNWTGVTNSPTLTNTGNGAFFGSVTFTALMTMNANTRFFLQGRNATYTFKSAGVVLPSLDVEVFGGTLQLVDDMALSTPAGTTLTHTYGVFDANNKNVTVRAFSSATNTTRSVSMGTGTWTAWTWNVSSTANLTGSASTLLFNATTTGFTFTSGGFTYGTVTFNGVGGGWTLQDALTTGGTLTLTAGTLDLNGKAVNANAFVSNSGTARTLTCGASIITLTAVAFGNVWLVTSSNFTFTAGTSTVVVQGANNTFVSGGLRYFNVTLSGSAASLNGGSPSIYDGTILVSGSGGTIGGVTSAVNFTKTGTAVKTDSITFQSGFTISGTFTLNGNSATNRILATSDVLGTQRSFTNTGATIAWSNVDVRDIALSSAFNASAITGGSGDCGGNSGITFTTPQTNFWVADTGSWSDSTKWKLSDHTTAGRVPLPQDDVRFDASSFTTTGRIVTIDMPRAGKTVDWTGATNTPAWSFSGTAIIFFGGLTMITGMTKAGSFNNVDFQGRGAFFLTTAGRDMPGQTTVSMVGGSLTLTGSLSNTQSSVGVNNGTFDAAGFPVTATSVFTNQTSATRSLKMGGGAWTVTGDFTPWNNAQSTGLTFVNGGSTLTFTSSSVNVKFFQGGGQSYGDVSFSGGGSGVLTINGSNTFTSLTINAPKTVNFTVGTTQTVSAFSAFGSAANPITMQTTASGSAATISQSSGIATCDYLTLKDMTASGGATFFAGSHTTNVSGNTGWTFTTFALVPVTAATATAAGTTNMNNTRFMVAATATASPTIAKQSLRLFVGTMATAAGTTNERTTKAISAASATESANIAKRPQPLLTGTTATSVGTANKSSTRFIVATTATTSPNITKRTTTALGRNDGEPHLAQQRNQRGRGLFPSAPLQRRRSPKHLPPASRAPQPHQPLRCGGWSEPTRNAATSTWAAVMDFKAPLKVFLAAALATMSGATTRRTSKSLTGHTATNSGIVSKAITIPGRFLAVLSQMTGLAQKKTQTDFSATNASSGAAISRKTLHLSTAATAGAQGDVFSRNVFIRAFFAILPFAVTTQKNIRRSDSGTTAGHSGQVQKSTTSRLAAVTSTSSGLISVSTRKAFAVLTSAVQVTVFRMVGVDAEAATAALSVTFSRLIQTGFGATASALNALVGRIQFILHGAPVQVWKLITVAPDVRSIEVTLEPRSLTVSAEIRSMNVAPESRSLSVKPEIRSMNVASEPRTVSVPKGKEMSNNVVPSKTKDPDATLDYPIDWSKWLDTTDTIQSVTWVVPTGITQTAQSNTNTAAVIWLAGGTVGRKYRITCRITTSAGRTEDFSFDVVIAEK